MRRFLAILVMLATSVVQPLELRAETTIEQPNQYPSPSVKQPAPDDRFDGDYSWRQNTLTGDWGGLRGELAENGIVFDILYVSILMGNTHGGFDTGFYGAGPLGITVTLDTERFCGHDGGTLFFDWEFSHWYNGRFPNVGQFDPTGSYVGDNTNFSSSDDPGINQISQLYYEQLLADDHLSLAFGKMDANVPFASVMAAAAFQNNIAMYTSTLNPFLPTYPNEATAVVATVQNDLLDWKLGLFDGTTAAFDPATGATGPSTGPRGPRTFFDNDGHWLWMTQADASWTIGALPGTFGAGAWLYDGTTATAASTPEAVRDVPGWYLQWSQCVWSPSAELAADNGGIAYFGQFGWSDPRKNPVHWSLMTGVSATGVFPGRPADAVGILYSYSAFSDDPGVYQSKLRNGQPGASGGSEQAIESYYIWQWTSWSYLQPGVMWIGTPGGGDPAALDDALALYLLVGVEL